MTGGALLRLTTAIAVESVEHCSLCESLLFSLRTTLFGYECQQLFCMLSSLLLLVVFDYDYELSPENLRLPHIEPLQCNKQ